MAGALELVFIYRAVETAHTLWHRPLVHRHGYGGATPGYASLDPIEPTLDRPPLSATSTDGNVTWILDRDTATLEVVLPDHSKLYLLAPDAEILYHLLDSAASQIAQCSTDLIKHLKANYHGLRSRQVSVTYLVNKHPYQE